jgi:hypothetical protein
LTNRRRASGACKYEERQPAGAGWQFLDRTLGDDIRFRRLLLLGLLITALATQPSAMPKLIDTFFRQDCRVVDVGDVARR